MKDLRNRNEKVSELLSLLTISYKSLEKSPIFKIIFEVSIETADCFNIHMLVV